MSQQMELFDKVWGEDATAFPPRIERLGATKTFRKDKIDTTPGGVYTPQPADFVNRPPHYNKSGIETIDAIRAALGEEGFMCFCRGNALKYVWRAPLKGQFKEDMAKAAWYCRMAAGDDPRKGQ